MWYSPASKRFSVSGAPLVASKADRIWAPVFESAEVTKTRFCQMTGELWPAPAIGRFQRKFFCSHFVGMPASSLWPAPFGPRKRSQLPAEAHVVANTASDTQIASLFVFVNIGLLRAVATL